jgi:hypothetical protein
MHISLVRNTWAMLGLVALLSTPAVATSPNIRCEVAIVGGGAAGMHTFYRLAPQLGNRVCLFEKNNYFGGRIKDIDSPNGTGKWAAGAFRVMNSQTVLFNLAKELGIELEESPHLEPRVFARGEVRSDVNDFAGPGNPYPTITAPDYPDYSCTGINNYPGCFSDAFYRRLFSNSGPLPRKHQAIEDYALELLDSEQFQYLKDTSRFRADFTSKVDARSYVDYAREEWDNCCTPFYPIGGMSEFILRMLADARGHGGRAFSSEAVKSMDKSGDRYHLSTSRRRVIANRIVIAVPPLGLKQIGGTVANRIKDKPQFKAIQPVRVVSIQNWWREPWWSTIDRGWATPETIFKFNFVELPHSPYQQVQMAMRSVYNDDPRTTQLWIDAHSTGGEDAINAMIVSQLGAFFPEATISTSQITKTHFQNWRDGWHWLRKGSNFSNADIAVWALKPLNGERVSLVGEAYNPNRSSWSDAAYKSSINSLNGNFGLNLDCATVVPDGNGWKYVPFNDPTYVCPAR